MMNLIICLTIFSYLLATLCDITRWFKPQKRLHLLAWWSAGFALTLHAYLLYRYIDIGVVQNLSATNIFSQMIWLVALMTWLLSLVRPVEKLRLFIFPLSAISVLLMRIFPDTYLVQTAGHPEALWHILLSLLTVSVLGLTVLQALLVMIQERLLRAGGIGGRFVMNLPPLEISEAFFFRFLRFGFGLLSIVLLTSFLFFGISSRPGLWEKTIFVVLGWGLLGGLLWGHRHFGWRGQIAVRITLISFILLITG